MKILQSLKAKYPKAVVFVNEGDFDYIHGDDADFVNNHVIKPSLYEYEEVERKGQKMVRTALIWRKYDIEKLVTLYKREVVAYRMEGKILTIKKKIDLKL